MKEHMSLQETRETLTGMSEKLRIGQRLSEEELALFHELSLPLRNLAILLDGVSYEIVQSAERYLRTVADLVNRYGQEE